MPKGESSRDGVRGEVLRLAMDGEHRNASYFTSRVEGAKNTILKYLKELAAEGFMKISLEGSSLRPTFRITEKGLAEAERRKVKDRITSRLDSVSIQKLRDLDAVMAGLWNAGLSDEEWVRVLKEIMDQMGLKLLGGIDHKLPDMFEGEKLDQVRAEQLEKSKRKV